MTDLLLSIVLFKAEANSPSDSMVVFLLRATEAIEEIGFILPIPRILSYNTSSK